MTSFKDKSGASWDIELTLGSARRLAARTGLDFLPAAAPGAGEPEWPARLADASASADSFVDVVVALVEPQIEARGLTPDAFAELLDGDAIRDAQEALAGEIVNFSHPALRPALLDAMRPKGAEAAPASPAP